MRGERGGVGLWDFAGRLALAVAVLAVTVLAPAGPAVGQGGSEPGTVTGVVRESGTGSPLAGARVTLGGREVLTDVEGRFRIAGMAPGGYVLAAEQFGYRGRSVADVRVRPARVTVVEVELEPAAFELGAVVVAPSYFPEPEVEPAGRFGYGGEEVRRAPGSAGDVSRVLMSLPSLAKVNDQSNGLIVRGGSPLENAFVVDGIEIPNINHFPTQGASSGPIGLLNVDLIRNVELFAGAFPARWGDRLSSVLEVELREGNREESDVQADLSLAGFGGVVEGPLPGGVEGSWLVSARRSWVDLLVEFFDVGATVAPSYGDYQGKVVVEPASGHTLSALAIWADDHMESDLEEARENAMLAFGRQDIVQGTTGIAWSALWGDRVRSETSLSHTLSDYDEASRELATDLPLLRNRSTEQWVRLRSETRAELPTGVRLGVGGELARLSADYDNVYFSHVGPTGDTVPALAVRDDLIGTRWGAFATAVLPVLPRLTATLGIRADGFDVTEADVTWSPRGSLAYRVGPETVVSASAGVYRQSLPAVLLAQSAGNRALRDPRAVHWVLGFSHLLAPDTRVVVEAYRKDYDRMPMDPAQPGLFPLDELFYDYGFLGAHPDLVDTGEARAQGVEAVLRKKLSGSVYGLVSGAWFRVRYRGLDEVWRDRVVDNRYVAGVEGGWQASDRWELSARWLLAGGTPYAPLDEAASAEAGRAVVDDARINEARYPAYHSLNVRVDRRFHFRRSSLVAYLSVWNAYDRRNIATYYWHTEEERVASIRQWGLLPIFGLEYEL